MPTSTSQRRARRGVSTARITAYAASVMVNTRNASGLLNRNISAATGVSAMSAPAIRPAAGPNQRLTPAYVRATVPSPIRAWGTSIEAEEKPKMRAERTITHNAPGGLSTVIELPASSDPNSHALSDSVPDLTAAA